LPLRRWRARAFVIITPGSRGPEDRAQDQKRTLSLPEAIARGADYVVVGRPISEASDPRAVVAAYEASLASHRSSERTQARRFWSPGSPGSPAATSWPPS